jgi:predicted nucleic acid-binding protein
MSLIVEMDRASYQTRQAGLGRRTHMSEAVGLPDVLVAAVAERERVTVLHYDAGYEIIAKVTGQAIRWVMPRVQFRDGGIEQVIGRG